MKCRRCRREYDGKLAYEPFLYYPGVDSMVSDDWEYDTKNHYDISLCSECKEEFFQVVKEFIESYKKSEKPRSKEEAKLPKLVYDKQSNEWAIKKDSGKIFLSKKSGHLERFDGAEIKPEKKVDEKKLKEAAAMSYALCKDLFDLFDVDINQDEIYENVKERLKEDEGR